MNNFEIADILYFNRYFFTDTSESAPHFALVVLPSRLTSFESSILCAVITSNRPTAFFILLEATKYNCFSKQSFVCFNRLDFNSIIDLDRGKKQPLNQLDKVDKKQAFKVLRAVLYGTDLMKDIYIRAVIVREWKLKRND